MCQKDSRSGQRKTILVCFFVAVFAAMRAASQTYSVTDLAILTDLPGRNDAKPNAVNRHGVVAAANVINGSYRALLYGGSWTNLGTLGGSESLAGGVEDLARAVGWSVTTGGATHAFLW